MTNLDTLLKVALSATPGPWKAEPYLYGMTGEGCRIRVTSPSNDDLHNLADDVLREDAEFIATFDPPTVLALLSRLEQAEQDRDKFRDAYSLQAQELEQVEQDRDAALEANKRWAHRSSRETSALRKANASIARVRALRNTWCDASYDPMNSGLSIAGTVNAIDRALDGDGRG